MNNRKLYITFKYNDDKKIYLDKVSMLEVSDTSTNQYNGNITPNKILYKDVNKDIISKSLNIEL